MREGCRLREEGVFLLQSRAPSARARERQLVRASGATDGPSSPSSRTSTHSYPAARSNLELETLLTAPGSAIGLTEDAEGSASFELSTLHSTRVDRARSLT